MREERNEEKVQQEAIRKNGSLPWEEMKVKMTQKKKVKMKTQNKHRERLLGWMWLLYVFTCLFRVSLPVYK